MKKILFIILLTGLSYSQSWYQAELDSGTALTELDLHGGRLIALAFATGFEADTVTFQAYDPKGQVWKELNHAGSAVTLAIDVASIFSLDWQVFNNVSAVKLRANTLAAPDSASATRYINYAVEPRK